jgi:hypothetical protein
VPIVVIFIQPDVSIALEMGPSFRLKQDQVLSVIPEYQNVISDIEIGKSDLSVSFKKSDASKLLVLIPIMISLLFSLGIIQILYKLVDSAREQDFFNSKNVMRLRMIGFCCIAYSIYNKMSTYVSEFYFRKYFKLENIDSFPSSFSLGFGIFNFILLGVMILIIAQAFDYGLKLKEEQDLTI